MQSRPQPNKVTVGGVHGGAAAVEDLVLKVTVRDRERTARRNRS
jgi:hypothetical protein